MLDKAKAKLQSEMNGAKDNGYVQFVGQYLLTHIEAHPEDAEKITAEGKTVGKSLEAMRKVAEKKKSKGNVAMLTPQEGFNVVFEYYGIKSQSEVAPTVPVTPDKAATPPADDFDIDLDELLK